MMDDALGIHCPLTPLRYATLRSASVGYNLRLQGVQLMLALLAGLGDERLVDVGDDTTRGNRGLDEDVKLLVSTDGKLEMTGSHTLHLEVTGSVASKLKNLSSQVLQNSSHVHSSSGTDTPRGSRPLLQVRVNTSDR